VKQKHHSRSRYEMEKNFESIPEDLLDALPGCFCCGDLTTKAEMVLRHGSLQKFSEAVIRAEQNLEITPSEANRAISKYREQLRNAKP
jgi:hypothetical protein